MVDLPPFLRIRRETPAERIERLVCRIEELEHAMRDNLSALLEFLPPDDDLAAECRRLLRDLDR